jgi:hypothetical protein
VEKAAIRNAGIALSSYSFIKRSNTPNSSSSGVPDAAWKISIARLTALLCSLSVFITFQLMVISFYHY